MFKSLFDPESPFGRGMEKVWQLIVLNVLWLLCSLPVITLGASSAALYYGVVKCIRHERGRLVKSFFSSSMVLLYWLTGIEVNSMLPAFLTSLGSIN